MEKKSLKDLEGNAKAVPHLSRFSSEILFSQPFSLLFPLLSPRF